MISKAVIMRVGEYKCRVVKVHLKCRHQELNLYIYIMVTTNQESVIEKHNTKYSHQITMKEQKKKGTKRPTKTTPKQLTKWQ